MSFHGYVRTVGAKPTTPVVRMDLCRPKPKVEEAPPLAEIIEVVPLAPVLHEWSRYRRDDPSPLRRARAEVFAVSQETGIAISDIMGERRRIPFVRARHLAIRRVRKTCLDWSLPRMGQFFNKDHSSILYALRGRRWRTGNGVLRGEKNPNAVLTEEDVRYIRANWTKSTCFHPVPSAECDSNRLARMFGISRNYVCTIVRRETWKHVE